MPSEWTLESLKAHFDALRVADKERFDSLREADKEAVKAALTAAEKAVEKAEKNAESWRLQANEWRGAMNDRERILMPRLEAEQRISTVAAKTDEFAKRVENNESRRGGLWAGWGYLIAAVGLVATLIGIFAFWINKT